MKRTTLFCIAFSSFAIASFGQSSVGIGTTSPNNKAVLELVSPGNNQGLLVPRLTTAQRTSGSFTSSLQSSENGLLVYDSDDGQFYYWHSGQWNVIRSGAGLVAGTGISISGNTISAIPDGDGNSTNEIQNLSNTKTGSTVDVQLSGGSGTSFSVDDNDADPANEIQDLQLVGSTLSITNNPSATPVNLSAFTGTNTDDQTLSYNPTSGQLDISGLSGGNSVNVTAAGPAGGILSGTYPNPSINLAGGDVLLGALNNVSTTLKLATGLLDPSVILDTDVLGLGDIAGSFLSGFQINAGAVTSAELLDGTIATADLALNAVTSANILDGTISTSDILDGTIGTLDIANNAITGAKILDGTISTSDILDGTIGTLDIANDAITSVKILDGTISTSDILDGTIGTLDVANDAITSAKILDGTLTSADLLDGTIVTADLANDAVTNAKIATGIDIAKLTGGADSQVLRTNSSGQPEWINLLDLTGGLPLGIAGGDLTGLYPSPSIATTAGAGNRIISAVNNSSSGTIATGKLNSSVVLDSESPAAGDVSGTFGSGLTIGNNAVTTGKVLDGTLLNADINASAGIAVSKLAAGTNGQYLTTAGGVPQWSTPSFGTVTSITAGTGLTGGTITTSGTLALGTSGVVAGIYGTSASVPRITVDAMGRITGATTVAAADPSSSNEIQNIRDVLQTGADAGSEVLHSLKNLSVGTGTMAATFNVIGSQVVKANKANAGDHAVKEDEYIIVADGSVTDVTLPDANKAIGRVLIIRSTDSKGITIKSEDSADMIEGRGSISISNADNNSINCVTLVAFDKDTWMIINSSFRY